MPFRTAFRSSFFHGSGIDGLSPGVLRFSILKETFRPLQVVLRVQDAPILSRFRRD